MIFNSIKTGIEDKRYQSISGFFKDKKQNVKGLLNNFFSERQPLLSGKDIECLRAYNKEIDNCVQPMTAYYRTLQNASDTAVNLARNAGTAKVSLEGLTKASKAGQMALKAFSIIGDLAVGMAVGVAINSAVYVIDHYVNRVKYAREALADANAEYKNTVSEIENINTKLDSLAEKMHALTIVSAERLQVKILSAVKVHLLIQFRQKASRKKVLYTPHP